MNKDFLLFLKGFFMGIANIIPGVSGGTIALITNIYEDLIFSLKSFNYRALKLILNLKYIFPDKDYYEVKKRIKKGKFFNFEKKVSEENYEKLMKLGDKSIEPRANIIRVYPQKNLFSHIIGQIDNNNN